LVEGWEFSKLSSATIKIAHYALNFNFELKRSEHIWLKGANGSGKTALIKHLLKTTSIEPQKLFLAFGMGKFVWALLLDEPTELRSYVMLLKDNSIFPPCKSN